MEIFVVLALTPETTDQYGYCEGGASAETVGVFTSMDEAEKFVFDNTPYQRAIKAYNEWRLIEWKRLQAKNLLDRQSFCESHGLVEDLDLVYDMSDDIRDEFEYLYNGVEAKLFFEANPFKCDFEEDDRRYVISSHSVAL